MQNAETGSARAGPAMVVAPLGDFSSADVSRAGGKGAHLGELVRAGYSVPQGFVVTADAYAAALPGSELVAPLGVLDESRSSDGEREAAGTAVRAALGEVAIPEQLRYLIVEAYEALGSGPVAVRSSATVEDLPGAAVAGQHDTFLNIVGEEALVDAVRACWASLWTERAIAYRRGRGIGSADARIAVVVQRMVEAEVAGVLFTANPVTGARGELLVEASVGLGEAVVSGLVTPDRYRLDRNGEVLEHQPGRAEVVVRSAPGGGVSHESGAGVPTQRLPDAALADLARLGGSIHSRFGRPQDIEWAWAQGQVWVLQARPLTALPPAPESLGRFQRRIGPVLLELLPVRPFPLDMSMWLMPGLGRMVERMLHEIVGVRVDFDAVLPEVDGVVDRFVPPTPRPSLAVPATLVRSLRRARRLDSARWSDDPRFTAFQVQVDELSGRDVRSLSWPGLLARAGEALDALDTITDLRVDYLPNVATSQTRLLLVLRLLGLSRLFADLAAGGTTRTADANRGLEDLAGIVRADDGLRTAFLDLEGDRLLERLEEPAFGTFRSALEEFLKEYGHRETTSVLLISAPTWGDSPETVLGAIRVLVDQPSGPARDVPGSALDRLLRHPLARPNASRRWLTRAVERARSGIAMREDSHFHATRLLPVLRHTALEMGRRLVDAGVLGDSEEVLHLRLDELRGLAAPDSITAAEAARVRGLVHARASRRAELAGAPLISPVSLFPPRESDPDALVTGTPAGGGRATGPVRIIRGTAEFGRLRAGDILVCPYTNPAWTALFQRAAGVVVDTGGPASHAAIVAREFGIAAVMGTGTGTTALVDDQVVTVDGDRGVVTRAQES